MTPISELSAVLFLAFCGQSATPAQDPSSSQEKPPDVRKDASAMPPALTIGSPAPKLAPTEWIKGAPTVPPFEKGKIYVVEFWATWCPSCVANMPYLTQLQAKYKEPGVTFVGVTSADDRNTLPQVRAMVAKKGDSLGYAIAWDATRATWEEWMKAARQEAIPRAFIVDREGVVAFIGSPASLDSALEQILAGTYDLQSAAKRHAQETESAARDKAMRERIMAAALRARSGERTEGLRDLAALVDGDAKDDVRALLSITWQAIELEAGQIAVDYALALRAAERAVVLDDRNAFALAALAGVWFRLGDAGKAAELEAKAVEFAEPSSKKFMTKQLEQYRKAANEKK